MIEQLEVGGKLIGPRCEWGTQKLVLLEKHPTGVEETEICDVLYVSLRGEFGASR